MDKCPEHQSPSLKAPPMMVETVKFTAQALEAWMPHFHLQLTQVEQYLEQSLTR
jgi:hypothetical protein